MTRILARRLATVGGALGIAVLACAGTASVAAADASVNSQNVWANVSGDSTTVKAPWDGQDGPAAADPSDKDKDKKGPHGDFSIVTQNVWANVSGDSRTLPYDPDHDGWRPCHHHDDDGMGGGDDGVGGGGLLSDLVRALR